MSAKYTPDDPKGLIFEAYRIDGITKPQCRAIFFDWALSVDTDRDSRARLRSLLEKHGQDGAHPMTEVMTEGLLVIAAPHRRGGWRSRKRD